MCTVVCWFAHPNKNSFIIVISSGIAVFFGLKWRIHSVKVYFSPLPWTNQKEETNEVSR